MNPPAESPAAVPPWQLPDAYFADWNPPVVNEYIRRLDRENQLSLAIAAVEWAKEKSNAESPIADYLAGIKDDLTQALQLTE